MFRTNFENTDKNSPATKKSSKKLFYKLNTTIDVFQCV